MRRQREETRLIRSEVGDGMADEQLPDAGSQRRRPLLSRPHLNCASALLRDCVRVHVRYVHVHVR